MKHLLRNTRLQIRLSVIFIFLIVLSFTMLSITDFSFESLYAVGDYAPEEQLMVKKLRQETLLPENGLHVITTELLSILDKMQSAIILSFTAQSQLLLEGAADSENSTGQYQMTKRRIETSIATGNEKDDHRYLKLVDTALDLGLDTSILSFKTPKSKKSQLKKSEGGDLNGENAFGKTIGDSKLGSKNISGTLSTILDKNASQIDILNETPTVTTSQNLNVEVKRLVPVIDGKSTARKIGAEDIPLMGVDENSNPVEMISTTSIISEKKVRPNGSGSKTIVKGEISNSSSSNSDNERVSGVIKASLPSQVKVASIKNIQSEYVGIDASMNISSENVDGKLFYMYDLDEEFWWRWPHPDADCR